MIGCWLLFYFTECKAYTASLACSKSLYWVLDCRGCEGQDYYEGKSSERPVDPDVNEELLKATEPPPDIADMTAAEYEAYQKKRKSVGAAGEEVTGEIPLPDIPDEVVVTTESGERKTIRPKEDEAFSIVPIKGADGKVRYQLHDGVVYDISAAEAQKLMEYAGVKKKNAAAAGVYYRGGGEGS